MLVPLTASLYASGTLANTDHVLVDVGTGYFIEVCTRILIIGPLLLQHISIFMADIAYLLMFA